MLPFVSADILRDALPFPALIAALRTAFAQPVEAPPRHVHRIAEARGSAGPTTLLVMPAWQSAAQLGVKLVTVAADNPARGLPSVHSVYLLFDSITGMPLALFDGEELTQRRTAAASALAATYLAREDTSTLLMVGTGRLAPYLVEAHCSVRPIRRVRVWGRSPQRAGTLVERLRSMDCLRTVDIDFANDLAAAAGGADIISCATTSTVPILQAGWITPGCHVDLVGGFRPDMREADDALMARAMIVVDTFAGAMAEAGDLVQPLAAGALQREAIVAELADLATGRHPGRTERSQLTLFKSVGSAIEDLCAANLAWSAYRSISQTPQPAGPPG